MDLTSTALSPRKTFSRIGIALFAASILAIVFQALMAIALPMLFPALLNLSWYFWIASFFPMYVIAMPACVLLLNRLPSYAPEKTKLPIRKLIIYFVMCIALMYIGNIVGTVLSALLSGGNAQNALMEFALDTSILKVVIIVIIAPIFEEFIFRKLFIDKTRRFGEGVAVVTSALAFGLFHMNLFQFFYAFALGLIFAFIYVKSGKIIYPIIFHVIVNFMGSVLAPAIFSSIPMDKLASIDTANPEASAQIFAEFAPTIFAFMLYALVLFGLIIAGVVLIIINRKNFTLTHIEGELLKGERFKTVVLSVGSFLFILVCAVMIVLALL